MELRQILPAPISKMSPLPRWSAFRRLETQPDKILKYMECDQMG